MLLTRNFFVKHCRYLTRVKAFIEQLCSAVFLFEFIIIFRNFIYLFIERERKGACASRGRKRITSRLFTERGAQVGALSQDLEIMT